MALTPFSLIGSGNPAGVIGNVVSGVFGRNGLFGGLFGGQPRDSGNWLAANSAKMNEVTTKLPSVSGFSTSYRP